MKKLSRNVFRPSRRHNCEPRTKGRNETGSNAKAKGFPKIVWARPTDYTAEHDIDSGSAGRVCGIFNLLVYRTGLQRKLVIL